MRPRRILVLAPHADDEVLGVGGSMARWASEGHEVTVAIVTRGLPPLYSDEEELVCREEARAAHFKLGVAYTRFLDFPAGALDGVSLRDLNGSVADLMHACTPDEVYLPFLGDLHVDHQKVFHSALVAARPNRSGFPKALFAYETLSETNWNAANLTPGFQPTLHVDISAFLNTKLEAMACYRSQLADFPHERSLKALEALAVLRGATVCLPAAEAFVIIRMVA